nr:uncharacterized protein LOC129488835 [Symphalangus syndactylus]
MTQPKGPCAPHGPPLPGVLLLPWKPSHSPSSTPWPELSRELSLAFVHAILRCLRPPPPSADSVGASPRRLRTFTDRPITLEAAGRRRRPLASWTSKHEGRFCFCCRGRRGHNQKKRAFTCLDTQDTQPAARHTTVLLCLLLATDNVTGRHRQEPVSVRKESERHHQVPQKQPWPRSGTVFCSPETSPAWLCATCPSKMTHTCHHCPSLTHPIHSQHLLLHGLPCQPTQAHSCNESSCPSLPRGLIAQHFPRRAGNLSLQQFHRSLRQGQNAANLFAKAQQESPLFQFPANSSSPSETTSA